MIADYRLKLSVVVEPERAAALERHDRPIIVARLELAQPEHAPGRASLWVNRHQVSKRVASLKVTIFLVKNRPHVPPAIRPVGANPQCVRVKLNRFIQPPGKASLITKFDGLVERGVRRGGSLCFRGR